MVRIPASALAVGLALIAPGPAGAHRAVAAHRAITFRGGCQLSGTITFVPPLSNTVQPITQHARGTGTCSGAVRDRNGRVHELANAPVSYRATEYAPSASCNGGDDSGSGRLSFRYGTIRFTISEVRVIAAAAVTMKGARGGSAAGQANVSPTSNPEQVLMACAGAGLAHAPFDARATTTPSISG